MDRFHRSGYFAQKNCFSSFIKGHVKNKKRKHPLWVLEGKGCCPLGVREGEGVLPLGVREGKGIQLWE